MNSAKTWVFTLNNYTDNDINMLKAWQVKRILVSKEVGETGTPHLQGAITWTRTYRLAALKKLHSRMHWEVARAADCFNYCAKEGSEIIIQNQESEQGKRTDISDAVVILKETGIKRLRDECPDLYIKYHAGFEKLAFHWSSKTRPVKPVIYWYFGGTGTGKTYTVYEKEKEDLWISADELKWFDGYNGQKAVLFDDFRGDMCKFRWLLRLTDEYPLNVQIKGGFVSWVPERIYITSCKHPRDVYNKETFDANEKIEQLLRRIVEIKEFKNMHESVRFAETTSSAEEQVPGVAPGFVLTRNESELTFSDFGF